VSFAMFECVARCLLELVWRCIGKAASHDRKHENAKDEGVNVLSTSW